MTRGRERCTRTAHVARLRLVRSCGRGIFLRLLVRAVPDKIPVTIINIILIITPATALAVLVLVMRIILIVTVSTHPKHRSARLAWEVTMRGKARIFMTVDPRHRRRTARHGRVSVTWKVAMGGIVRIIWSATISTHPRHRREVTARKARKIILPALRPPVRRLLKTRILRTWLLGPRVLTKRKHHRLRTSGSSHALKKRRKG